MTLPAIPTIPLSEAKPGDIVLCHGAGFVSEAIRFGQKLRTPALYSEWNHVAVLDYDDLSRDLFPPDDPEKAQAPAWYWALYEATGSGIQQSWLDTVGDDYIIISADSFPTVDGKPVDRERVVSFAKQAVGVEYGFLTIFCIVVNLLSPRLISFRRPHTLICSALGMRALEHGGAKSPVDPFQITPAEVAQLAATRNEPASVA